MVEADDVRLNENERSFLQLGAKFSSTLKLLLENNKFETVGEINSIIDEAIKMRREEAAAKYGYNKINNKEIMDKLLDLAISVGDKIAIKFLQYTCIVLFQSSVKIDGVLSDDFIREINNMSLEKLVSLSANLNIDGAGKDQILFWFRG